MSLLSLNTATASNAGRVMPVLHPDDRTPLTFGKDKKALTLTLLGKDSDAFIRADQAARNVQMQTLAKGVKYSSAAVDVQISEMLARCTTGWAGIPQGWIDGSDDEKPSEFSYENAVALYSNQGLRWLRDLADEFVGDRRNFLKA